MLARRNNASALLKKVNSQLRGERIPIKAKDEDELATYLNNLTLKTQKTKIVNFEEYGEVSISSGADGKNSGSLEGPHSSTPVSPTSASAKRFLKKKPASDVAVSQSIEGKIVETNGKNKKKAVISASKKAPFQAKSSIEIVDGLTRSGQASGLVRLVSKDSESDGSIKGSNLGLRSASTNTAGRDGLKFLKSQRTLIEDDKLTSSKQPMERIASHDRKSGQRKGGKHKGEISRTLSGRFVSSDQDSLAEFIQALSTSESSARRPQNLVTKKQQKWRTRTSSSVSGSPSPVQGSRSPSPYKRSKSPFGKLSRSESQDTDMADLMDSEILEDRQGSDNFDDHFKINLMDVASLLPSSPSPSRKTGEKHSKNETHESKKSSGPNLMTSSTRVVRDKRKGRVESQKRISSKMSESPSTLFNAFGVHMVDELVNYSTDNYKDAQLNISEDSEIKTESSHRQRKTVQRRQSESEKATSGFQRKASSFNEISSAASSRSHDLNVTDVEYSDSFGSESQSISQQKSRVKKSQSRGHTSHNDSNSHRSRDHKIVMEEMLVDVSAADGKGGMHHWNTAHMDIRVSTPYGLQYVDPAPVATHVVSADALEALTAYSPNVLALQEMMKAQLQLIQNFVDIQRRIYQSCMDGLHYDCKYTTLEDTKEYISNNLKPRMTFKEASELVEQEDVMKASYAIRVSHS